MYLVTGGAGFIGSNIVAALDERNARVVICDRLRDQAKWCNIATRDLIDVIHPSDLADFLEETPDQIEAVIHMGAISSTTETDADLIIETNFHLSMGLWTWCAVNSVPFIYASSAATYGDGAQGFDDDESRDFMASLEPLNAYGWSKNLFDRRIARMIDEGEPQPPQCAGLKFFNVYGPNEYHKGNMQSVVSKVYPHAAAGEPATLFKSHNPDYEDGGQLRDFVWVGDCVDIVMWLLDNTEVSGLFNCGSGKARSFLDLTTAVYEAVNTKLSVNYVETPEAIRDKYQYYTQANMAKLRAAGYDKPATSLEAGIALYVRDYLHTDDPYR
ncbi:MAG: ADP-glyceromanno-heptose 6-epimerase [Rhodospirillales bacterium]|nr:ADP-glyceromanno-heptose 6-epimerase [Rhodospirillales bacterium]MBT4038812.1 ADP-glyceromanno-heptose 6-epimerase [Rhodospirillales bacterium]MBT4625909.1 ADP-glyceromanno-heptose 6-epimerase [Rhodospirillales bacterium]MBT5352345.1 ADP-glyceromanno-heptose 6-epimerase [Rhodospirillales bacterium]MBT5519664.1 ADP-glyceromanno-heptose 6-epimerase [Rhodospirillales bacterium]